MTVLELQEHLKKLPPNAKLFYYGGPDGDEAIEMHEFHADGQCYATAGTWFLDWHLGSTELGPENGVVEKREAFIQ